MSHCLVIKVLSFLSLRQLVYFITSFFVCQELFSSFFKLFRCSFKQFALSLTACLLYHTQKGLSTSFLTFFKVFQVISSKESFLCDSQINLPLFFASVNCFFSNNTKNKKMCFTVLPLRETEPLQPFQSASL